MSINNNNNRILLVAVSTSFAFCLMSCSNDDYATDGETSDNAMSHITVNTRTSSGDNLSYPISLYFYKNGGAAEDPTSIVINQEDVNAQGIATVDMPYGNYTAHAFSGTRTFTNGYTSTPLYYGSNTLTVAAENENLNMTLTAAVAKVAINIANVPTDVTAVSTSVAPQYTGIADNGAMTGSSSVTITCQKATSNNETGELWTTGDFYVLPGTGSNTTITVQLTKGSGTESYTMTYDSPLSRNTPYEFTLTYKTTEDEQGHVNVSFALGEWNSKVTQNFDFGPEIESGNTPSGNYPTLSVSQYPAGVKEIDGHAVIPFGDNHLALLFSKKNFPSVAYGAALSDITDASTYAEGSITGWTIPTTEEANIIIEKCAGGAKYTNLNIALGYANGDVLSENGIYLFNNNHSLYNLTNTNVTAAQEGHTYNLRLVRTVQLVKQ